jgi:hypothetical protein
VQRPTLRFARSASAPTNERGAIELTAVALHELGSGIAG